MKATVSIVGLLLLAELAPIASPVKQIDHVMFTGGPELSGLIATLRDNLQLPVAFEGPTQTPPSPGTCFSFGNVCLEVVPLPPTPGEPARMAAIGSLALQAENFATTVDALKTAGIDHFPPARDARWTTIGLRGLGGGMFFIEYHTGMSDRLPRFRRELDRRGGGALGIVRMTEVTRTIREDFDAIRERWVRLFGAPLAQDPHLWPVGDGPAVRVVRPEDPRVHRVVVQVASLARATEGLRRLGIPFTETAQQLDIDSRALQGLRLALVERGQTIGPERIAFVSDRDGTNDIFVMATEGRGVVNLTHRAGDDTYPSWSPDCQRLVFNSNRDGVMKIYSMRADGGDVRQLTRDASESLRPDWSPDSRWIAFGRTLDSTHDDLFVMRDDGSGAVNRSQHPAAYGSPAWSPDGTRLAFHSNRDGDVEIYVMNADGSRLTRITNSPRADVDPVWSPNGDRLAFASFRNGRPDIYAMRLDGRGVTRLTDDAAADFHPTWSPDGRRLAFHTSRDGNAEIYVMHADGSNPLNLTRHPANDTLPRWCALRGPGVLK